MIKFQGIGAQGNYSQAGKAVADDTVRAFMAARRNSPNYGDIAVTAAELRQKEKLATLKNQAETKATRIAVDADVEVRRMDVEAQSNYHSSKRKAGSVALAGQLVSSALDKSDGPIKPYKGMDYGKTADDLEAEALAIRESVDQSNSSTQNESAGEVDSKNSSVDPLTPVVNPITPVVNPITPSGGDVSRGEVYSYLRNKHGLSHNKAYGIMANIDRESSFRMNPAGGDNGLSFGLLQWHADRADLMKSRVPDFATNWKGQLDHALSQNQMSHYNNVTSDYLNTTFKTPQAASENFLRRWEVPADVPGGIAKNNNFIAGYTYGQ